LRFLPKNIDLIRPCVQALVHATRQKDGCLAYDVAEDSFDPGLLRFSKGWPDAASLARHLQAPLIAPWRANAAALGVHARQFTAFDANNPRIV
jgi:quinol monooxygenase YgiN